MPAIGGLLSDRFVFIRGELGFRGRLGSFVSGHKIAFPTEAETRSTETWFDCALLCLQAEHLALARPFGWHVDETSHWRSDSRTVASLVRFFEDGGVTGTCR
jgi:hypothetical protein